MNDQQQAAEPTPVAEAVRLAGRGFALFPADHPALPQCSGIGKWHDPATCEQRGKHPSVKFTSEHTTDPDEIRRQLGRRPQNYGVYVGACRGPADARLFVVDSDRPGAIEDVAKARGETWPTTMRVLTAKGYHDYLWGPADLELGNGLGALKGEFDGDVRAGNAYVIGPGSVHQTGVIYTLENPEQPPVPAPTWLLDALSGRTKAPTSPATRVTVSVDRLDAYTRKVVQDECDAITSAPDGDQNNTINTAAFNLGTLVGAGALTEGEARQHLLAAARAGNHPEGRALGTIASGISAGMAQPRHPWPPLGREGMRPDPPSQSVGSTEDSEGEEQDAEPVDRLPATFWNSTAVLRKIRQMAHARRASPDAVLHAVLARTAAMADPTVRVDGGIQQAATIGWYCGLFGPPGSGKGNAENTAEELTPFPAVDIAHIDISTGQGLISAYLDIDVDPDDPHGKKKITVQRRTRGYALATEGSVLEAMSQMSAAATLNGVLCKAWMSERQGTSNAEVERRRALPKGQYTLSMSLGVQEEPAAKLLEMGNIGLPQRLAWAHATLGPDTPKQRPPITGPVTITTRNGEDIPVTTWVSRLSNTTIPVPESVTDELDQLGLAIAGGRGAEAPLDTHEPLWRLKCAALLALLHGRTEVKTEDWDRAALMWQTSRKVRDRVQEAAKRRMQAEMDARRAEAVLTAAESQAAVYEVMNGVHPTVVNVAKRAHRYLVRKGDEVPVRDVNRSCVAPKDRDKYRASGATDSLWAAALHYGAEQGWLVPLEGGLLVAGSVAPE